MKSAFTKTLILYPVDTHINFLWLPTIRATLSLQQGKAAQAIEQLQATTRYEAAAEFWPPYLRGQAYLQLKQNAEAATAFQSILNHRGYAPLSPLYPLAQLGLARATQNRKAYEDFFAAWQEADADLSLLRTARRETPTAAAP
jgi:tetratricopeptide (TPR) repeat protein